MNIAALKAELTAGHPGTGAYNADSLISAQQINAVNRSVNKTAMTGDEIFANTDAAEFDGLSAAKQSLWVAFCGRDSINPWGQANVDFVTWIFGAGPTITALQAARVRAVSRADELGLGTVYPGHIEQARA